VVSKKAGKDFSTTMPVYIRSGELNIPAPSISTVDDEDEDGVYLLDPELVVDELPQPFRMIDKVLTGIVEDVWDEIVDREKKREEEMRRVRPPVYNPTSKVEEFTNLSCMVHSNDARYMFVAFETGDLVAFDAVTHDRVAQWVSPDETICFEKLNCAVIGTQTYLLATIDDMGFSRLIVFTGDGFHVIQLLNEQPEGSPKSNAVKFQLSVNGDFCGLSLECEGVSWVDFYKLPRDNWLREIENAQ
uniref:Uncharacterized protein n=1 Tax=Ciona intestinalis TaxID=7719 RepID=H2Y1Y1_CIOIN